MSADKTVWQPACIGVGSNLTNPGVRLGEAVAALAADPALRIYALSGVYQSRPLGGLPGVEQQPDFLNAVARIMTRHGPHALLEVLKAIESVMGRDPDARRWGPRVIDLDLLVYGRLVIDDDRLTVPHPGIAGRSFVLLPLREIAPDLIVPELGRVSRLPVPTEPDIARLGACALGPAVATVRAFATLSPPCR